MGNNEWIRLNLSIKHIMNLAYIINLTSHVFAELFPSTRLRLTDRDGDGLLLW